MRPFLDAAEGDADAALDLYAWNARMAGAALEQLSHLEAVSYTHLTLPTILLV